MGARLEVESEPGQWKPLYRQTAEHSGRDARQRQHGHKTANEGTNMNLTRILIVDDEATLRMTMAELLASSEREIVTAASGEEALAYIEDRPFDLVIVDLIMPGIDGLQVMDVTQKLSPQARIIMLTAFGTLESAIQAMRRGATDYLLKPANAPQIESAVERALNLRYEEARREALIERIGDAFDELRDREGIPAHSQPVPPRQERFLAGTGHHYRPAKAHRHHARTRTRTHAHGTCACSLR